MNDGKRGARADASANRTLLNFHTIDLFLTIADSIEQQHHNSRGWGALMASCWARLCGSPADADSVRPLRSGQQAYGSSSGGVEMSSKERGISTVADGDLMASRPRVHRARGGPGEGGRGSNWGVEQRMIPLKDCTDEMILAELEHRNIRLHERVTESLVNQRYKFGKMLGQGSSAAVYEARQKRTGREFAIKVIKRDGDMNDEESMTTELEILKSVHHRYILNCHELFETPQCIWVVMEIIRGGELLELLIEGGVYTERDAARAMRQAFLAISYLHSNGIVHRDLKLQNMLLTEKERTSDLKICDFGLSAVIPRAALDWGDKEAAKAYKGLAEKWGTPQYFAPEMLWKAYGPQVDLWALGVVLFQLLVGRLPFNAPNNKELFQQIERSPEHLRRLFNMAEWQGVSEPAKDLVAKLLHPDPRQRLNADEALTHEWIVLKGVVGTGGDLKGAQMLLKQQVAQKRLTALWHVLDIMNALDGGNGKKLPPKLQKKASELSSSNIASQQRAAAGQRSRLASSTDRVEELQTLFNLFDTDGNGSIDRDEIAALFRKLGFEVNPNRLQELVNKCDQDSNGALEFPEFCEFLRLAKHADAFGSKSDGTGIGIAGAVEDSLSTFANGQGYISEETLAEYLTTFAEETGHVISDSEIQDILALAGGEDEGGGMRPQAISEAMLLNPQQRHQAAEQRRQDRSHNPSRVASGYAEDEAPTVIASAI